MSIAIVDSAYAAYLAGPTQITLTTSWQRFKITGTLAGARPGCELSCANTHPTVTTGRAGQSCCGACVSSKANDPKEGYTRTWAFQTANVAAGVACGPVVISGINSSDSPLKVHGPGSNLADHTLLEVTAGGELIIGAGSRNGYRFAELMGAFNPSGWSGVFKVKNPVGVTAGYILLYSNP